MPILSAQSAMPRKWFMRAPGRSFANTVGAAVWFVLKRTRAFLQSNSHHIRAPCKLGFLNRLDKPELILFRNSSGQVARAVVAVVEIGSQRLFLRLLVARVRICRSHRVRICT